MIVRKLEALFTINTNTVQFKKAASQLDGLASKAETVMKTIAGYWAVQALQNFVTNTAKAMAEVGKTAEYLGVTAEALQELHYAAEKSGVSVDALNDAIKEIQVRATDAKSGQGEAAEAFKMLGLSSTDAAGRIRESLELLDAVADRLKALPSHSERIWIADAIFGDEGSTVLKMLKDGSVGLHKLRREARSLGHVLDSEGTAKAARFSASLKGLKTTSQVTGNSFVQGLLRPLTWLMEKVTGLANAFNQLESRASVVRVTLLSLSGIVTALAIKGGVMLAAFLAPFLPLIGIIAGVVAGIVAASLVVEDLYVAIKGGDSLIASVFGSLYDGINNFCSQASTAIQKGMSEAFAGARKEFSGLSKWLSNASTSTRKAISDAWASARQEMEQLFEPIRDRFNAFCDWLKNVAHGAFGAVADALKQSFANGLKFVEEKFAAFQEWINGAADRIKERIANLFDGLMPDFVKNGIVATIKHVSSPTPNSHESQHLNARLAPTPSSVLNQNRVSSNQSVNVAVNVKSGANPQDIGGEVTKAIRKELERERFNAFMGVSQYAG